MSSRTRIASALVAASLVLTLAAAPVLAAAGPLLTLSPGRGASGTTVTMTMKNCTDPRLWVGPSQDGATAAFGASGYIRWSNPAPFAQGYQSAGTWAASGTTGTTWTTSFTASFPSGRNNVIAWCGPSNQLGATFTVR